MSARPNAVLARDDDDMCPVCKTTRYINKDLELLIHPDCYHRICLSCVNRRFNDGPQSCPAAFCGKTLRRRGFRSAFFSDLQVEREVDIRRRVQAVFNQREDDFETARDYNDYLQMVEDLTADLVQRTSEDRRRRAERQLDRWEADHRADIERNRRAGQRLDDESRRRLAGEKEAQRQGRLAAQRELDQERRAKDTLREKQLDALASGKDPAAVAAAAAAAAAGNKVHLKRRGKKHNDAAVAAAAAAASAADSFMDVDNEVGKLSIRGLKERRRARSPEGPYDPFGGLDLTPTRYSVRRAAEVDHPVLSKYRLEWGYTAPGYSFDEYVAMSMWSAFAGLGVFIEDEKGGGAAPAMKKARLETGTVGAGEGGGDPMDVDG